MNACKDEPMKALQTRGKLDGVKQPYENLYARVCELCTNVQSAQIRSQQFDVTLKDFLNSLNELEELCSNVVQSSAVYANVKQQKQFVGVRH